MKLRLLVFLIAPFFVYAQDNYFVANGNLDFLTPYGDSTYVGIDEDDNLVMTDYYFNPIWSIGSFSSDGPYYEGVHDISASREGQIYVLNNRLDTFFISVVSDEGEVLLQKSMYVKNGIDGDIEVNPELGIVAFAFIGKYSDTAYYNSVIYGKADMDLNIEWVHAQEKKLEMWFTKLDLELYEDTIMMLTASDQYISPWGDHTISAFSKFTPSGDVVWCKKLGGDCSSFNDFERLPNGQYVVVGEKHLEGDDNGLKIAVTNSDGEILATRERRHSTKDFGFNDAYVEVFPDGRYVVSDEYYIGLTSTYIGSRLYYFDHHKLVGQWTYDPVFYPYEYSRMRLWGIDEHGQLLITGKTDSDVDLAYEETKMGRMSWRSESCGLGVHYDYPNMYYRYEETLDLEMETSILDIEWSPAFISLTEQTYSNTFVCETEGYDDGALIEEYLIVVEDSSWVGMCPSTTFWDDTDDDDDGEDDPWDEDGDGDGIDPGDAGDGGDDDLNLTETVRESLIVYPNPSNGNFTISGSNIEMIQIFSMEGKLVFEAYPNKDFVPINLEERKGVFLVHIIDGQGHAFKRKILVQ